MIKEREADVSIQIDQQNRLHMDQISKDLRYDLRHTVSATVSQLLEYHQGSHHPQHLFQNLHLCSRHEKLQHLISEDIMNERNDFLKRLNLYMLNLSAKCYALM